jgi:hypothetical protein
MNPIDDAKVEADNTHAELNDAELDAVNGGAGYLNGAPSAIVAQLGNMPPLPSPSVGLTTNVISTFNDTSREVIQNIKS